MSSFTIPDACDPTKTALVINGTAGNDKIHLTPASGGGVQVTINGVSSGPYTPTGRIIIFGYGGDDWMQVAGSVPNEVWMYGDAGNDDLNLGNGGGIAFGGDGNDKLLGGSGRDILVGGEGTDHLVGNGGDDILIAAFTDYDDRFTYSNQQDAWCHIMEEWQRSDATFQQRIDHLMSEADDGENDLYTLNLRTLHDDSETAGDKLTGSSGSDWYAYKADEDKATGMFSTEAAKDTMIT